MKKILSRASMFAIVATLTLFVSCSKDDDNSSGSNEDISSSELVGKWEYTLQGELNEDGEEVLDEYYNQPDCDEKDYILFRSDGTGEDVAHYSCEPQVDAFEWSLSNNILQLSDGWMAFDYEIVTLTSSTLKFYFEYEIEFNGETTVETLISVFEKTE